MVGHDGIGECQLALKGKVKQGARQGLIVIEGAVNKICKYVFVVNNPGIEGIIVQKNAVNGG